MQDHVHILGQLIKRIMAEDDQNLEGDVRVSIVLMGSFQSSNEVNDIDLILIYDKFNMTKLKKEYKEMTQLHRERHICIYEEKWCQ